jgi:hypothetical protein
MSGDALIVVFVNHEKAERAIKDLAHGIAVHRASTPALSALR